MATKKAFDTSTIKEGHVHHYAYTSKGVNYKGKGEVIEITRKRNGTKFIIEDKARNQTVTCFPAWIVK